MNKSSQPNRRPGLTETEYELMTYFWNQSAPVPFAEILHYCNDVMHWNWAKTTAHTYLTRLLQKNYLGMNDAPGMRRTYFAKVSREEYAHSSALEVVNSSFSGSLRAMLLSLVPDKPLTREEADELYEILDQLVQPEGSGDADSTTTGR